jgi:hypothetical protein
LCQAIPDQDFELVLNDAGKPKRGSFEIYVVKGEKKEQVWSGAAKGPPRKDKFPNVENDLKDAVLKIVNE